MERVFVRDVLTARIDERWDLLLCRHGGGVSQFRHIELRDARIQNTLSHHVGDREEFRSRGNVFRWRFSPWPGGGMTSPSRIFILLLALFRDLTVTSTFLRDVAVTLNAKVAQHFPRRAVSGRRRGPSFDVIVVVS